MATTRSWAAWIGPAGLAWPGWAGLVIWILAVAGPWAGFLPDGVEVPGALLAMALFLGGWWVRRQVERERAAEER